MPRVEWSPAALTDLARIDDWLIEFTSDQYADRMLSAIRSRVERLESFPLIGRTLLDRGFRVLTVPKTPYLAVYRFEGGLVQILRIRHQRQNWIAEP